MQSGTQNQSSLSTKQTYLNPHSVPGTQRRLLPAVRYSGVSSLRPDPRQAVSPPSSHWGPVRVSRTLLPVLAPASRQTLPITPNPPNPSHALAAQRTSGGERRAANRRCRRNPEKSLKPSRGKTKDSRGAESPGSFRLSLSTYPTDTQPRHVDKPRPRMRTLGAPTGPHNPTQGCRTGTPERDSHAKPRTHKGTGRC